MINHTSCNSRPYPLPCSECGKFDVWPTTIAYKAEVKHDGRLHKFDIPELHVNQCKACNEIYFSSVTDEQISQALRERLSLLSPEEIRKRLDALGLTQKEFGSKIRVAPETISRWLSGEYIQSGSSDASMRMFFELEEGKRKITEVRGGICAGEIHPWQCQMPYRFAPVNTDTSSEIGPTPNLDDLALAA